MSTPGERQRVDRWLWHARIVRTRSSAAALAQSGHVHINGQRIDSSSRMVKPEDVLTIALAGSVKILRVIGFSERRGNAAGCSTLFEDLSPPPERKEKPAPPLLREPGSGRPTKKDRRALDRLQGRNGLGG